MKDILGLLVLSLPLVLLVLIVLAMLIAVPLAIRYARKGGRNKWAWGVGVFLLIFLPVFWDWIPTVLMHKYYCSTEAGFWVYKTVDQWKAENPGVAETLMADKGIAGNQTGNNRNYTITHYVNQRFNWITKKTGPLRINNWRWEKVIVDSKTDQVLARYVDFSTGDGSIGGEPEIRFWLHTDHCDGGAINNSKFFNFADDVANLNDKGMSQ